MAPRIDVVRPVLRKQRGIGIGWRDKVRTTSFPIWMTMAWLRSAERPNLCDNGEGIEPAVKRMSVCIIIV